MSKRTHFQENKCLGFLIGFIVAGCLLTLACKIEPRHGGAKPGSARARRRRALSRVKAGGPVIVPISLPTISDQGDDGVPARPSYEGEIVVRNARRENAATILFCRAHHFLPSPHLLNVAAADPKEGMYLPARFVYGYSMSE
jgi:hypothetical protein